MSLRIMTAIKDLMDGNKVSAGMLTAEEVIEVIRRTGGCEDVILNDQETLDCVRSLVRSMCLELGLSDRVDWEDNLGKNVILILWLSSLRESSMHNQSTMTILRQYVNEGVPT